MASPGGVLAWSNEHSNVWLQWLPKKLPQLLFYNNTVMNVINNPITGGDNWSNEISSAKVSHIFSISNLREWKNLKENRKETVSDERIDDTTSIVIIIM